MFAVRELAMNQAAALLRGLSELRSHGHVSPDLVHPEVMYKELAEVQGNPYKGGGTNC